MVDGVDGKIIWKGNLKCLDQICPTLSAKKQTVSTEINAATGRVSCALFEEYVRFSNASYLIFLCFKNEIS
jgi:hypothetical protein